MLTLEVKRFEINGRPIKPVSLRFANVYGSDPRALPIPGEAPRYNVRAPRYAADGTAYLMPDGSVWEYLGTSAYDADNRDRVRGWQQIIYQG